MIQQGKRVRRCALLSLAMLGMSGAAFAQTPPAGAPAPAPGETPPVAPDPNAPPTSAAPTVAAPVPAPDPVPPPTTFPTMNGPQLRLSELFSIRPGIQMQFQASYVQDTLKKTNGDSGEFAKNFFIRRARFFVGGNLGKEISYLILTETSNLGQSTADATGAVSKNLTNFSILDAFADLKPNKYLSIQAGLMLVPFTRNILQSTATYWSLDIAGVSATYIAATQTSVLRDAGLQVKLNALENKLEARAMVSGGVRSSDGIGRGPGKNDPRLTGYLQYNFLDPDTGYVFNGQYFGRKKIAGVAVGVDYQKTADANPYFALSGTLFGAIPLKGADAKNGGDEFGGQIEVLHFHNGRIPGAIGKQDDVFVEAGYYNKAAKVSVFGKFEGRFFDGAQDVNDLRVYGGGLKYFLAEAFANVTLQYTYSKLVNQTETRNAENAIRLQIQLAYY